MRAYNFSFACPEKFEKVSLGLFLHPAIFLNSGTHHKLFKVCCFHSAHFQTCVNKFNVREPPPPPPLSPSNSTYVRYSKTLDVFFKKKAVHGSHRRPWAPPPPSSSYGTPLPPLHPLKLFKLQNAKRLQHVAVIVSVIELLTRACMYY